MGRASCAKPAASKSRLQGHLITIIEISLGDMIYIKDNFLISCFTRRLPYLFRFAAAYRYLFDPEVMGLSCSYGIAGQGGG